MLSNDGCVYQPKHTIHPGFGAKSIQAVGWSVVSPLEYCEGHRRKRPAYSLIIQLCWCRYCANCTLFRLEREEPVKVWKV